MFAPVPTIQKRLSDYRPLVGDAKLAEIEALAAPLRGSRVLHLSATAFGTEVTELLGALVPLMNAVGLSAQWQVIRGSASFQRAGDAMYEALAGVSGGWTAEHAALWEQYSALNAGLFDRDYDFVVVHDPQPAGILAHRTSLLGRRPPGRWIWHCHVGLDEAQPGVWDALRGHVGAYDALIFAAPEHVSRDLPPERCAVIGTAIDPLGPKNAALHPDTVSEVLRRHGVAPERPVISQMGPLDRWHDPCGVIDAYRLLKRDRPDVQLLLVAAMSADDAAARLRYEQLVRYAGNDRDVHILSTLNDVGNVEINAFQRGAQVTIQRSARKGFAPGLLEAMWKGRPVLDGSTCVAPAPVLDGVTGYLTPQPEQCADRLARLLGDPQHAAQMGEAAREYVRERFLITGMLWDYLRLFMALARPEAPVSAAPAPA